MLSFDKTNASASPDNRLLLHSISDVLVIVNENFVGNAVNVPVYIDEKGQYNRVFIDTNKIATVFGRDDFSAYIQKEIQNGNLVRIKNKSIQTSELTALIAGSYSKNASDIKIAQNESDVNTHSMQNQQNNSDAVDATTTIKNKSIQTSELTALIAGSYSKNASDIKIAQNESDVNTHSMQNQQNNSESNSDTVDGNNSDIRYSSRNYSYDALTSKPDMKVIEVDDTVQYSPSADIRKLIIKTALKNAAAIGGTNENGNVFVHVKDIDTDVMLSKNGLGHGLDRRLSILTPVTLNAGEIIRESIRINEMIPENENISESYVLIGMAKNKKNEPYLISFVVNRATNEVTSVDVLYAINTKTEPAGSLSPGVPAKADRLTGSIISISNLLNYVNKYFTEPSETTEKEAVIHRKS